MSKPVPVDVKIVSRALMNVELAAPSGWFVRNYLPGERMYDHDTTDKYYYWFDEDVATRIEMLAGPHFKTIMKAIEARKNETEPPFHGQDS